MKQEFSEKNDQHEDKWYDHIVMFSFSAVYAIFVIFVDDKFPNIFHIPINEWSGREDIDIKAGLLVLMLIGLITQKILYAVSKFFNIKIPHYAVVSNILELLLCTMTVVLVYVFLIKSGQGT